MALGRYPASSRHLDPCKRTLQNQHCHPSELPSDCPVVGRGICICMHNYKQTFPADSTTALHILKPCILDHARHGAVGSSTITHILAKYSQYAQGIRYLDQRPPTKFGNYEEAQSY